MGTYTNTNSTNYPPYLEIAHSNLLDTTHARVAADSIIEPSGGRSDIEVDDLFFDAGGVISNFPALFDLYGKFMAGLDISILFDQIINDTTDGKIANDLVSKKSNRISNEVASSLNRFNSGINNTNAIMSGIYLTGSSLIQDRKTKTVDRFKSEVKYKLLPSAINRWSTHLSWNKTVVTHYVDIIKLYYKTKIDVINTNLELNARDELWPLDLLEFERSIVGLLTGATSSTVSGKNSGGASDLESALGGALSGASAGFAIGGGLGAAIGGTIGLAASFF